MQLREVGRRLGRFVVELDCGAELDKDSLSRLLLGISQVPLPPIASLCVTTIALQRSRLLHYSGTPSPF